MISAADFEDLFPQIFRPEADSPAPMNIKTPGADCVVRLRDEPGAHLHAAIRPGAAIARKPRPAADEMVFENALTQAAIMPAAAALAAAWTVLSTYEQMTESGANLL